MYRLILRRILLIGFLLPSAAMQSDSAGAQDNAMSSTEVSWVFEASIKDGQIENLEALIKEMSDQAEATEPGTLSYEWLISDDRTSGQTREYYKDSQSALVHLASFNQNFAERLMTMIEPKGMIVYGTPSSALKNELAGADPVYMQRVDGFAR